MCLPMAIDDPARILGQGTHLGFEWMVLANHMGHRCGYVRVLPGHPWHGQGYDDVRCADNDYPDVHGGLTFASADEACEKPGDDNGWWLGFDCAHAGDSPDPALASVLPGRTLTFYAGEHVWTQAEVEAECRSLCEQASRVTPVAAQLRGEASEDAPTDETESSPVATIDMPL